MSKMLQEKVTESESKKRAKRLLRIEGQQLSFDEVTSETAEKPADLAVAADKPTVSAVPGKKTAAPEILPEPEFEPVAAPLAEAGTETSADEEVEQEAAFESVEEDCQSVQLLQDERPDGKIKRKNQKFRFKVLAVAYTAVALILSSWLIYNAVDISNTERDLRNIQNELATQNAHYENNSSALDSLLKKLGKPNEGESNSVFDGFMEAGVVEITPRPLDDISNISPKSNWFDAIINWISGSR